MTAATTVPAGTPALNDEQMKEATRKAQQMKAMAAAGMAATGATPTQVNEAKLERNVQMPPGRMQGREYTNYDHVVVVENNWTMDDVVKPIFWSSVWQKMRRFDKVAVTPDDGSWWAELLVTERGTGYVFVKPLRFHELTVASLPAVVIDGFEIREMGVFKKWCVVRTEDAQVIKEKCDSRAVAESWLQGYQEQLARSALI